MSSGGHRDGAGRPRLDKNGLPRKNHAIYCTVDEVAELKKYLMHIRKDEKYKLKNIIREINRLITESKKLTSLEKELMDTKQQLEQARQQLQQYQEQMSEKNKSMLDKFFTR